MQKYSFLNLVRNAFSYHENWQRAWRSPEPKSEYDVVIVGGGGHGLATAYYLVKEHQISSVAVLEKGFVGGGNTGRNTEIVRSNYLWDEAAHIYEFSLKLWEGLTRELNFNLMFSQRGLLSLGHTLQDLRDIQRRVNANILNGIDSEYVTPEQIKELVPIIDISPDARYPILGASLQRRGGTARHDALAWGLARAADSVGVDIIQNCEVTGIRRKGGAVKGVETSRGFIKAGKVGCVTAGNSGVIAAMAGLRLPLESRPLQACVSEPIKPALNMVVMSNAVHAYISQTDRGELLCGAGVDSYNGYAQRGSPSHSGARPERNRGDVPPIQPGPHAAAVGRDCRHLSGCLPHHRPDSGEGALFQLRLGYRRLQIDTRFGLGLRLHHRSGQTA